jgi:peroxiredoxin Q/BCP
MLNPGDKLPPFELPDQTGQARVFKDLCGPKGLVIFVYPKDMTGGCTTEAREFQERHAQFDDLGFHLAGLSKDPVASHQRFANKLALDYPLLSDLETGLIRALGAWGEKNMYGKKVEGTVRGTWVADKAGRVRRVYAKVKAPGHAAQVLADLRQ